MNAANRILPRLTLVAMGMKFGTKWAITRHMYEMFSKFLHLTRGFESETNNFSKLTFVALATKFVEFLPKID